MVQYVHIRIPTLGIHYIYYVSILLCVRSVWNLQCLLKLNKKINPLTAKMDFFRYSVTGFGIWARTKTVLPWKKKNSLDRICFASCDCSRRRGHLLPIHGDCWFMPLFAVKTAAAALKEIGCWLRLLNHNFLYTLKAELHLKKVLVLVLLVRQDFMTIYMIL